MFLPRPKCRCVASMILGKIAMFSSLIKVPMLRVDDTIQWFSPTKVSTAARRLAARATCFTAARAAPAHCFEMLQVLIVCIC